MVDELTLKDKIQNVWWTITAPFTFDYWNYMITGRCGTGEYAWPRTAVFTWRKFFCRMRNHPEGVIWYGTAESVEPDCRCIGCGDDLG